MCRGPRALPTSWWAASGTGAAVVRSGTGAVWLEPGVLLQLGLRCEKTERWDVRRMHQVRPHSKTLHFSSSIFFQLLLLIFSCLRKAAWDYGRLALLMDNDR